jgi:fructosamine-3-kinase
MIEPIIEKYKYIKKVNNVEIISFHKLINMIQTQIYILINNKNDYFFVPIHGDCQFNNILYNNDKNEIYFIDPRGYYGDSKIYGIPEYDYAKVLFALSGYDEFDNRQIDNLIINDDNIEIFIDMIDKNILKNNPFEVLLMLSIWLGNSHSFIKNENKAIYSYFISIYLGSLYFNFINPVIE